MTTIKDIKAEITEQILSNETLCTALQLDNSTSWEKQVSAASVLDVILTVIATTYYALNWMFDTYKAEVDEKVLAALPGTKQWYYEKAMAFRYGQTVNGDDIYANELSDDSVLIVKYCAVIEQYNGLLIKVNKENHVALSSAELAAFTAYIAAIKFAGVFITVSSLNPDRMSLTVNVARNAMLLGSIAIAQQTLMLKIGEYLDTIQPDGILNVTQLITAIVNVDGVDDVKIVSCSFSRADDTVYTLTEQNYSPVSGSIDIVSLTVNDM